MGSTKQVVFCLTTTGLDIYWCMQLVAINSLRRFMPSAKVKIAIDDESFGCISSYDREKLDQRNVDLLVVDTPEGSAIFRNRWLKTNLRQLISGEFLYLDADLVVRGEIHDIWTYQGDIVGVLDRNQTTPYFACSDKSRYASAGWSLPRHGSINGGVLFWRNTASAHLLGQAYHSRWLEIGSVANRYTDQQALNKAIDDCDIEIGLMPSTFNCMERYHPKDVADARIWHFIFSNSNHETRNNVTHWEAVIRGEIAAPPLDDWSAFRYPWIVRDPFGWFCLHWLRFSSSKSYIKDWRRLWLIGERVRSLKTVLKKVGLRFL